jgi:hypothetical protein
MYRYHTPQILCADAPQIGTTDAPVCQKQSLESLLLSKPVTGHIFTQSLAKGAGITTAERCAVAQVVVSFWFLTTEAQVHCQDSPCVIVVEKVALGQVLSCQYHSTTHSYIIWGMDKGPVSRLRSSQLEVTIQKLHIAKCVVLDTSILCQM